MRVTDRDHRPECHVIPFHRPSKPPQEVTATSIAAVIALTILHSTDESPEDRLLDILEQSGDVEVLDADDAMEELDGCHVKPDWSPANDNSLMGLI
tara:strand:- start:320 stop:607 length:288 start_codon:yes stop_codon:yes gene_type:complete